MVFSKEVETCTWKWEDNYCSLGIEFGSRDNVVSAPDPPCTCNFFFASAGRAKTRDNHV